MNSIISIVIPTFNAEVTIKNAIESVLNQTYKNIELVIVDGLSSDNTLEIVKQYSSVDNRIKYISEPDSGIYDAMNKGWKMASGEWIHFLGADDELLPSAIEILLKDVDSDIIYGNTILKFKTREKYQVSIPKTNKVRYRPIFCHQSCIMRKTVFFNLSGFDVGFRLLADFDLIQRAYLNDYSFQYVNETISLYSVYGQSSNTLATDLERLKICKKNKSSKWIYYYFIIYFIKKLMLIFRNRVLILNY